MAGTIAPFPKHVFLDNNGAPAVGYQLFIYAAGTTTKLSTYTDSALTSANTNPIVLDSAGRCTMFLDAYAYKFVLASPTDTDPPASPIWTVDNVNAYGSFSSVQDVTGTAGEALVYGEYVILSSGFGGATAGRWYKADADAPETTYNMAGGFVVSQSVTAGNAVTVRLVGQIASLSGLTAGAVYYVSTTAGAITTVAPANVRRVGTADSTGSIIVYPSNV